MYGVFFGLMALFALVATPTAASSDGPDPTGDFVERLVNNRCAQWEERHELIHVDQYQYSLSLGGSFRHPNSNQLVCYGGEDCWTNLCDELRVDVDARAVEGVSIIEAENARTGQSLWGYVKDGRRTTGRVLITLYQSGGRNPLGGPPQRFEDTYYIRFFAKYDQYCAVEHTEAEIAVFENERLAALEVIAERDRIHDNCVAHKTRNWDTSALAKERNYSAWSRVRWECAAIADDPSWFQRWRWGS